MRGRMHISHTFERPLLVLTENWCLKCSVHGEAGLLMPILAWSIKQGFRQRSYMSNIQCSLHVSFREWIPN